MTKTQQLAHTVGSTRIAATKVWGHEFTIVNNDRYCGKILEFRRGHQGSLHYHPEKCETFLVVKGTALVEMLPDGPAGTELTSVILRGSTLDSLNIPAGIPHRVKPLLGDVTIIEFSSPHSDADVVRIAVSE